jgi:hypothetical protein
MTPPQRPRSEGGKTGAAGETGEEEEGGSGGTSTGGKSATGGKGGTGGSPIKLDAAPELPEDAGAGGSGAPDSGPKRDASRDFGPPNPNATFEKLELVLANCVYCHNDPTKRLDLQYSNLHGKLVNAVAEKSPTACPTRVVVTPGDPMNSLIYLKVAGTMASTCGVRMPFNKPMVTAMELKVVHDWIMSGAPGPAN